VNGMPVHFVEWVLCLNGGRCGETDQEESQSGMFQGGESESHRFSSKKSGADTIAFYTSCPRNECKREYR
jgi:hypothetical protein